ncbi:MAG: HAD-IA family hydrolase [Propionicimonas sp.]
MCEPRWPCVVFDLDGTVVNTIPLIISSYRHAMDRVLGETPTDDEARGWIGQTLYDTFHRLHPAHAQELIDTYIAWNLEHLPDLIEEFDGVPELLDALSAAGVLTGVATSKRRTSAEVSLQHAGLSGRLPVTVAMDDTAVHKPNPEPLLLALTRIGRSPGEAAYVGDAVVDVLAARAAGMSSIAVSWGAAERDALVAAEPDFLVDTVAELRAVLLP